MMMRVHRAECKLNVLLVQAKQKMHLSNGIHYILVHLQEEKVHMKCSYYDAE